MKETPATDPQRDMDPDARHSLELAVDAAVELGQERIGTEHLLLGLVAHEHSGAGRALADAGVTLSAARHKVAEAAGPRTSGDGRSSRGAGTTSRATRALNRAVRFSHARRSEVVTTEDVLLGVLDVEGTAGQVLRRLGVDLDRLRATLTAAADADAERSGSPPGAPTPEQPVARTAVARVVCPACGVDLRDSVALHVLTVRRAVSGHARDVEALACAECGVLLGFAPA